MNLLFLGDVVGRSGREAVTDYLPNLRLHRKIDFVVVNADNSASGFGANPDNCKEFFAAGADVITCGDHVWDQKELLPTLRNDKRVLRPHNFPATAPGTGLGMYETKSGKKVAVLHLLGQVFHRENANCPFAAADNVLETLQLTRDVEAILVDIHAEATSEKMAMGVYLDGRVSLVVGSHTHVPTMDARILPKGTAYQTDAGMCGDYNSVIGFKPAGPLQRFLSKMPRAAKLEAATGKGTLCATFVELDEKTGLAVKVEAIQIGGALAA